MEKSKDELIVQDIKSFLLKEFQDVYGYAGLAEGDNMILINSGDKMIKVEITWEQ